MARPLRRVRQHVADRCRVGGMDRARAAQLTLGLGLLLGEDVAPVRAASLDAAGTAHAETLRRALLRLHLGHEPSFVFSYDAGRHAAHALDASAVTCLPAPAVSGASCRSTPMRRALL